MWQDMGLYWAWRGKERCFSEPPTNKRLEYARINYQKITMRICCGVFDDDKYTEINRDEIKWHENHSAKITWKDYGQTTN